MRRSLLTIAFVLMSLSCFGQVFRFQQFCQTGAQNVITQGLNSTTHVQRSYPSCTVAVYLTGTTTLATIYSDALSTPLANPFTANTDGSFGFWAAPATTPSGCYDVTISGGNPGDQIGSPFTFADVCVGIGSGGGGSGVSCSLAVAGAIGAFTSPTGFSCDPNFRTDFNGNFTAISGKFIGPVNGFFGVIGGAPDPGTVAAFKLNTNEVRMLAPLTVPTPYYWRIPGTRCAVGQGWQMTGETTDANGDKVDTYGCATFASSGGVEGQVNGTDLANCTGGPPCSSPLLNFIDATPTPAGMGLMWSNPSGGQVQPILSDGSTRANNPVVPVATVNGTPGTTDYKYAVAGCENVACTYHSALSPVKDVTTGAATITSTNSITLSGYADTLYGYRFYVLCRTASSGTPATTGVIALGVGKAAIDTGLTADGSNCATTYASNTTVLSPLPCLSSFSPGGNSMPGAPCGIDAPPLSPMKESDEFGEQFGAPGDLNDGRWAWVNQAGSTVSYSGGTVIMTGASGHANTDALSCLMQPVPATPFTFVTFITTSPIQPNSTVARFSLGLFESATGKYYTIGTEVNNGTGNGGKVEVFTWSNNSTPTQQAASPVFAAPSNGYYYKIQITGGNIIASSSPDGIVYAQQDTRAVTSPFTTAPDKVGICTSAVNNAGTPGDFDYFRRTQ